MRIKTVVKEAAISGALIMLVLFTACDGGGGGTDEERYFEALEEQTQQLSDDIVSLEEDQPIIDEGTLEERKASFESYFGEFQDVGAEFLGEIRDLEPPPPVAALHTEYADSIDAVFAAFERYLGGITAATSDEELFEATASELGDAETVRLIDACGALQDFAERQNIEVELECGF